MSSAHKQASDPKITILVSINIIFRMSSFFINTKKNSMKYSDNLPAIEKIWGKGNPDYDGTLSIVVVGASGNLAMLKVHE